MKQLYMVLPVEYGVDLDKKHFVRASHEGEALWIVAKLVNLDKFELMECGYMAFPVPEVTDDGEYNIRLTKRKKGVDC